MVFVIRLSCVFKFQQEAPFFGGKRLSMQMIVHVDR